MSNCIEIDNGCVPFHKSVIDTQRLKTLIDRVKGLKEAPEGDTEGYYAWWFLTGNVVFTEDHVVIGFGQGCRSSHTNRDFRGLLLTLKSFFKIQKTWTFRIRDEYDNFKTVVHIPVNFMRPEEARGFCV